MDTNTPNARTPMNELPSEAQLATAFAEGTAARLAGKDFRDNARPCAYTLSNFPGMTLQEFDASKRPLMEAWFDGFLADPEGGNRHHEIRG